MGNVTGMGVRLGMASHQRGESHSVKVVRRGKVQSRHATYLSMWLHNTGSARFSREWMYFSEIVMDAGIREDVIQLRQSFHAGLQDLPFKKAPITPVLTE